MRVGAFIILCTALFVLGGCKDDASVIETAATNNSQIIKEVESAVWALYSADTSMNSEGVIDLLWPECTMLIDGNRINYEQISQGSRQFMSTLELFHTEWTDLQVIPISEDAAVTSFIFTDSIIVSKGETIQSTGPNTFLWRKRNNEWRILYGDADHYPVGAED